MPQRHRGRSRLAQDVIELGFEGSIGTFQVQTRMKGI